MFRIYLKGLCNAVDSRHCLCLHFPEYHFGDETVLEAVLAVDEERKKLLEEEELLTQQGQSVRLWQLPCANV